MLRQDIREDPIMKLIAGVIITTLTSLPLFALAKKADPADIVFTGANIYTVSEKQPRAQVVAVKGDKIVYVGSSQGVKTHVGPSTKVIDLKGATIVPGLTDAHYHLMGVGLREVTLNLEGTRTLETFLAKVKQRVDRSAPGKWVTGRGWIETFWKPQVFPTRQ